MTAPAPQQPATGALTLRAILSVVETVAFVVAAILAIWFDKSDAIIAALIAASAHAANHNAGGSPL